MAIGNNGNPPVGAGGFFHCGILFAEVRLIYGGQSVLCLRRKLRLRD
jgi:hypothetical protein